MKTGLVHQILKFGITPPKLCVKPISTSPKQKCIININYCSAVVELQSFKITKFSIEAQNMLTITVPKCAACPHLRKSGLTPKYVFCCKPQICRTAFNSLIKWMTVSLNC